MAVMLFDRIWMIVLPTNWALVLTLMANVLVIWYSFDPKIDEKKGWLALLHILIEITTITNVVVVIMYCALFHDDEGFWEQFGDKNIKFVHVYLIHIFPSISNLIILFTTNV